MKEIIDHTCEKKKILHTSFLSFYFIKRNRLSRDSGLFLENNQPQDKAEQLLPSDYILSLEVSYYIVCYYTVLFIHL